MSLEESVDFILTHRSSLARFGDGELGMIYGDTLGFQKHNQQLGEMLRKVLTTQTEGLLVCIPDGFEKLGRYNQVEVGFWKAHCYYNRKRWYSLLDMSISYGNTFMSRFYSMEFDQTLSTSRIEKLKKLWNGRDVIFIEGSDTKMGVGNDLFDNAKSIRRVICPSKDAFARYEEIVHQVVFLPHEENDLFILALGPTATVMAAELQHHGLQALDLGHLDIEYEWYKMGVKRKVPITGKFSNEAAILGLAQNAVTGEIDSQPYMNQIIIDLSN